MEADWSVEIGPDLPSVVVPWEGFVDLRNKSRDTLQIINEAASHPSLREALFTLNSKDSPVFTSKCDAWSLDGGEIDKDEFGATDERANCGFAAYIDVLIRDRDRFRAFEFHELWVRDLTRELRTRELPDGRIEFVVRSATVQSNSGFAVTIYAAGCGADPPAAYSSWETVLRAAVNATMSLAHLSPHMGE